jgi:hypothetical protein
MLSKTAFFILFLSGSVGRPKLAITREQLDIFYKANYTGVHMAKHFGCSTKTVYNRLKAEGLQISKKFDDIPTEDLDEKIGELNKDFPNTGSKVNKKYKLKNLPKKTGDTHQSHTVSPPSRGGSK